MIWGSTQIYKNADQRNEYDYELISLSRKTDTLSHYAKDGIQRGANVFGWESTTDQTFYYLDQLNIEFLAIMPFEYQLAADKPEIKRTDELGPLRKKDSTFIEIINLAHSQGKKIMLKPHLWIERGWRNEIMFEEESDWDIWFDEYAKITMQYAKVAQLGGAEVFCIGTELKKSIDKRPKKWRDLIKKIRTVYDGKLTYAANWDKGYREIPFWRELDYIGVQAYFPMKVEGEVSVPKLRDSLRPYIDSLGTFSRAHKTPVLFTEVGYRSIKNNYQEPWKWPNEWDVFSKVYCEKCQAQAFDAFFQEVQGRDWYRGSYLWEYEINEDDGPDANQRYNFSPRHKELSEKMIRKHYGEIIKR